jgi:hypothetical protein
MIHNPKGIEKKTRHICHGFFPHETVSANGSRTFVGVVSTFGFRLFLTDLAQ